MDAAKIRLSPKEMDLVLNADWILTKNGIMEKAKGLLAALQDRLVAYGVEHPELLNIPVSTVPPKISKGENYRGLPYLVLDYPRIFNKQDVLAIRTMFWWGHFFSLTLQLGGSFKNLATDKIVNAFSMLQKNKFYHCVSEDEWEHHFESDNYISLENFDADRFLQILTEKSFIKIATKIPLQQWDAAPELLFSQFKLIVEVLAD
jgi:hypothetical protein